jgi:hypothetical protein
LRAAATALDSLTADLAALGGVALGTDTRRRPLTWSAHSAATQDEYAHDKTTGQNQPTGNVTATVALVITVRVFELLDALGSHFSAHGALTVHDVSWHADWDNPRWRDVRAAAIQAAIAKGRDYATALGGQLSAVEHIADPGLLGGGDRDHWVGTSSRSVVMASGGGRTEKRTLARPGAPRADCPHRGSLHCERGFSDPGGADRCLCAEDAGNSGRRCRFGGAPVDE